MLTQRLPSQYALILKLAQRVEARLTSLPNFAEHDFCIIMHSQNIYKLP